MRRAELSCSLEEEQPDLYPYHFPFHVFRQNVEKRIRCLPEIDGLAKETVLNSWMLKFDQICRGGLNETEEARRPSSTPGHKQSVTGPPPASAALSACGSPFALVASNAESTPSSKEQLYDMFQQILSVKKYEHQILFNACQVNAATLVYAPQDQ